jgi:hypothetical protein
MTKPNEKPILFSTEMVKAILEGRKTMTRRVMKPQPMFEDKLMTESEGRPVMIYHSEKTGKYSCKGPASPYGMKGDVLWVRETFVSTYTVDANDNEQFLFKANDGDREYYEFTSHKENPRIYAWKPSIHMPKRAARIWLEITNIRAERLNDITDEDAAAEGIEFQEFEWGIMAFPDGTIDHGLVGLKTKSFKDYMVENHWHMGSARKSFETLWQFINGTESWNANPWVWVISFKVLSTKGKPSTL